jgi:CheY-like chemotaxis protein
MVILLVEDDISLQYLVWRLLTDDGVTVLLASSGPAALEVSRRHRGPIDVVLTDLEMPKMNGLELSRILVAERPGTQVLTMSGDSRWQESVASEGLPFLQKPFGLGALRAAVGALAGSSNPEA